MTASAGAAERVRAIAMHVGVIGSYLAIALLHLRPLGTHLTSAIARGNRDDALLHGWILNWTARQLGREPWHLFDSNSFFPFPRSLAYTEHFVPEALPVVPLARWVHNPVLLYNVAFVFTFVAAGWGTFLLVRRLTGSAAAGWVGGAFACWFPAKRWTLAHLNTIAVHWVPFALLSVHSTLRRPSLARAFGTGLFVALAALSSAYYTFYFPLLLVPAVLLMVWADRLRISSRRLLMLGVAAVVAALLVAPILAPYTGLYARERGDYVYRAWPASGTDVAEFLILDSWLWGWTVPRSSAKLAAAWFPGVTALGLALLALAGGTSAPELTGRRVRFAGWAALALGSGAAIMGMRFLLADHRAWQVDQVMPSHPWPMVVWPMTIGFGGFLAYERRACLRFGKRVRARCAASSRHARVLGLMVALAFGLSMGQQLQWFGHLGPVTPLYWLYRAVPLLGNLRAPYRVGYLGMALLAVLVGIGAARTIAGVRRRWRVSPWLPAAAMILLMQGEFLAPAVAPVKPPAPRPVDRWLAEQPGDFGVLELPQPPRMFQTARYQWRSVYHWKRRVTGHNGFVPAPIERLHHLSTPVLGDELMRYLVREFPVRYVLLDLGALSSERRDWALRERLPELRQHLVPERRIGQVEVLRVLNGGAVGNLRRMFPRWMVAGTLHIELAATPGATAARRLLVRIDDHELSPVRVRGAREITIELPQLSLGELPRLTFRASPRNASPLQIRRLWFRHADGSVYP